MQNNHNICHVKSYPEVERLVKQCASKGYRRLLAAGCSVDFDDVVGEMNVSYVLASQKFDPTRGIEFTTYLVRTIWQNFNHWADGMCEERHVSLDTRVGAEDDETDGMHNLLPSAEPAPDEAIMRDQHRARITRRVSPITRKVIELLESPPPFLVEELRAYQARSEHARVRGIGSMAPRSMTLGFIIKALGLSATMRKRVYSEIEFLVEKVNNK